jgi:hypothetical protein
MRHPIRTPVALAFPLFVAMSCNGLIGNDPVYLVGGSAGDSSDAGAGAAPDESGGRSSSGGASSGGRNAGGAGGEAGQGGAASCTGECVPGTSEQPTQRCGLCNKGTQTRRRTCSNDCKWGAFSEWSTCVEGAVECMPNEKQSGQQNCGACSKGTQTRSRTCTAQCTWGAWSAWSDCNIDVECQPNHYDCCGSNHWHWCLPSTCTWSTDCTPCTAPNCDCP